MNQENFKLENQEYLKKSLFYLGFGEALNKALEEKINSGENKFIISAEAKFNLNKNQKDLVNYELNFNKHEATGNYYLNSYKTTVELHNNQKHSQNFFLGRGIDFTAKEAYNLLSGRGVKKTANINSYSLALFADDKLIQKSPNLLRLEKDILPRAIKEHNAQKYAIVVMNENEKAVIKNFDNKGKETPLHRTGKLELSQKFVRENDKSFDIIPFPVNNMNEAKKALIEILTNKKIDSVTLKENGLPIQTFNKNGKEIQLDLNAKQENVWIKLNFSQKDNYNNYPLNTYYQNWGYNLKEILNKLPIQEIQDPIKRDYIIASLEKGNAQPVNIPLKNGDMHALIAYADPQFKKIGLLYQDSLRPVYENNNKNVNQIQIKEELAKENPLKENPVQEQIPKQKKMKHFKLGITNNNQFIISPKPIYCFIQIIPFSLITFVLLISPVYLPQALIKIYLIPALIAGILLLFFSLYKYYYIRATKYIFQKETLSIRTGVFNLTLNTLELYRIKDFIVNQYFWMRVFKIMNISIYTAEKNNQIIILKGIQESNMYNELRTLVNQSKLKNGIVELT